MEWTRIRDWLIGATAMILGLGIFAAVLWWAVSDPDNGASSESHPSAPVNAQRPTASEPPPDLLGDQAWFAEVALDAGTAAVGGSMLRDVRAVGQDVVTGPDSMVAAQLAVEATVPFEVVAAELGDDAVVRATDNGQVRVIRSVEALGREQRVTATGTVEVEDGTLVMVPRSIDVGGPGFLADAVAAAVRKFVTLDHEIEGLPEGLVLQDVEVTSDGLDVRFQGEDVEVLP